ELAASVGNVSHPLLRKPEKEGQTNKIGVIVLTSNRGLAGAYNGSVLRMAASFMRQQEAAGKTVELQVAGKKGVGYFNFQRRPIAQRLETGDMPRFADIDKLADHFIVEFTQGRLDSVHVVYMNFVSAGVQRAEVMTLL